jgi:hypothetical protein
MTIVQQIRNVAETAEQRGLLGEFYNYARLTALHGLAAHRSDEAVRATERVQRILKAAVGPINTTSGAAIAELKPLVEAFSTSLIGLSAFDTLLANGMKRVPFRTRGTIVVVAPTGGGVNEGDAKPVSQIEFGTEMLEPQKAWCAVVVTNLLLSLANPSAAVLFGTELKNAVARATDALFLSQIIATTTPLVSAGNTFGNLTTDLAALLAAVDVQPGSRLFLIVPTSKAQAWALMNSASGGFAFPNLSVTSGGPLVAGIEVLISDQLPPNRMVLIVADGLVGNSDQLELRRLTQGDIQLSSTPDNPSSAATVLRNLWQNNLSALACERWLGFEVVRARSVASMSFA